MANEEHLPIRVPDVLFQYCSTSAIDIFDKRRIKSSTPSTLNDPFEWKPVVAEQATADQIWKAVTTTHNRAPLPETPTRVTVARMKSNVPAAAKRYQDQFRIDVEKKTRIICFSQRNDGILMWAHYADRHKGFVVGFKAEVLRRCYLYSGFYKVSYGIERPVIPHPYVGISNENQLIAAVTQKSTEWKYEEEWRLLVDVTHLCRDSDPNERNLYLPIPSGAIDQVIFGSGCSDPLISRIETALENTPGFTGIRRFKARLDPKLFRILVEKL